VPPTVRQIGRWAADPVWRSELCRMLDMDFGELPFPRTSVNKGKKKGPEQLRPGLWY